MRQSERRKILWFLVFLFVIIGGSSIFYAQGYRLDFSPLGIQKIGAIYVKSFPTSASVYLDGEQIEKNRHFFGTSFFFLQGGTLINDLFPKKYTLTLRSDGYKDWKQTMDVKPSLVAEAKYAVLMPIESSMVSTTSIPAFWLSGNNIVSQTQSGTLKSGIKTIPGSHVLDTAQDGKVLSSDRNGNIFASNLNTGSSINTTVLMAVEGIDAANFSKITLDDGGNNVLFAGERNVYILNLTSGIPVNAIRASSSTKISALASSPDLLAVSTYDQSKNTSAILIYDKNSRSTLTYPIRLPGKTIQMEFKNGRLGLIENDGSFYYGDPRSTNGLLKIASDAQGFSFSNNLDLAAVLERNALEVISLSGNQLDYKRLTPPNPSQIKSASWYFDEHHLFLNYTDKTLFLDTEDAHLEHLYEINFTNALYMPGTNEIYFLDGSALKKIIFPS